MCFLVYLSLRESVLIGAIIPVSEGKVSDQMIQGPLVRTHARARTHTCPFPSPTQHGNQIGLEASRKQ